MEDLISRQAAIEVLEWFDQTDTLGHTPAQIVRALPTAEPEIIRCRDCEYGEQDEEGWWYCSDLGCQMGDEDGSGFCADAERREDD